MSHLEISKLCVDFGMLAALVWLSYRFLRMPHAITVAQELRGIEGSMKDLLRESDSASRELQGKLEKRQAELKNLLFDLESVEQRVEKVVVDAEKERREVMQEMGRLTKTAAAISANRRGPPDEPEKEIGILESVTEPPKPSFKPQKQGSTLVAKQTALTKQIELTVESHAVEAVVSASARATKIIQELARDQGRPIDDQPLVYRNAGAATAPRDESPKPEIGADQRLGVLSPVKRADRIL